MAVALTYNDLLNRIGGNFHRSYPFWAEQTAASVLFGTSAFALCRAGHMQDLPSLPSGVSGFIPTSAHFVGSSGTAVCVFIAELINLGSLDISGASGTFTDGSAYPTATELGTASVQTWGPVLAEVTTATNATPGSMTFTYVDQNGNTAEVSPTVTLPVSGSVGSAAFLSFNSPDLGARDITAASRTGGTTPTGVIQFWGLRVICNLNGGSIGVAYAENLITSGFIFSKLGASAKVGVFRLSTVSLGAQAFMGSIHFIGDST